jgi:tRNA-specific adenosine deaminase 3
MPEEDAAKVVARQDPLVQELVHESVEHGVLIPLKTTLELGDNFVSGQVLITRTPVKSANPVVR